MKTKNHRIPPVIFILGLKQLSSVNAYALFVACDAFKLYNAVNKSKESIVRAFADANAGANVCASLSYDYVTCSYAGTVRLFDAETLRITVASVLCRTNAFFVSKKL